MTYSQIIKEIYYDNKKWIYAYLTICLVFSVLAFGNAGVGLASEMYTATEAVGALGGDFGKIFAPMTQGYLSSIDTPTVLTILCIIALVLEYIPAATLVSLGEAIDVAGLEGLKDYSFGVIDFNAFKVLCVVWFVIVKLLRSNRLTYTTGVILEDVETKIGAVVTALVVGTQFLANIPLNSKVQAATLNQATNLIKNPFNALLCFVLLVSVLVIYFFVRYLFYFIDIIMVPICSVVEFSSTAIEIVKTLGIVALLYISIFHPYIFCIIFTLVFIAAIICFKKAYITIRYFKAVYVKPFFRGIVGYDKELSLISSKVPNKVKQFVKKEEVLAILPVYMHKSVNAYDAARKHDRWWMVITKEHRLLCKPALMKNTCHCIDLKQNDAHKMFIKKSLRYFEIFNLEGGEEDITNVFRRVKTNVHFVFSKEYYYRFDELKRLTGFVDYNLYKEGLKTTEERSILKKKLNLS